MQKPTTIEDYNTRITRAIKFIDDNYHRPLTLKDIAEVTAYSEFHIHKIMSGYLNESIGAYIKRIRLEAAASFLVYSTNQVSDIALQLGYEDLSSFSRAFRNYHGVSPVEYRKEIREIFKKNINDYKKKEIKMELKEKIVERSPRIIAYVQVQGDYNTKPDIAWEKLSNFVEELELPVTENWFGIVHDDPEITDPGRCRYDACIELSYDFKLDGELGVKEIFNGKYALFEYKGSYKGLSDFYNTIYGVWFPESGYELRDIPTIEKYINDPATADSEDLITEIYIPIH